MFYLNYKSWEHIYDSLTLKFALPTIVIFIVSILLFTFRFISKRKHLLATLLSLEGLILMIFSLVYISVSTSYGLYNFAMVFLVLAACEGALGLALLVSIVRGYGSDSFNSLNFLQC